MQRRAFRYCVAASRWPSSAWRHANLANAGAIHDRNTVLPLPSSAWWHANLAYAGLARFAMARFRASAALRVRMGELGGIKSCEFAHSVPQLSFSPPILTQRVRGDFCTSLGRPFDCRKHKPSYSGMHANHVLQSALQATHQRYKDERVCGLNPQLPLSPPISTSTASWKEGRAGGRGNDVALNFTIFPKPFLWHYFPRLCLRTAGVSRTT
ncbi:hypothetical protein DFH11DRAFT_1614510 [Phellopilus nigrolimitatus]|nr:hypothetical protein DFH11DRAFT_1614510 [Phellopilus nigrolimitatus]